MAVLPLLAEPHRYHACVTDLLRDAAAREHWLDLFGRHIDVNLTAARAVGVPEAACAAAAADLRRHLDRLRERPDLHGRLDILLLDHVRQAVLLGHGIEDEFRLVKARENGAALAALPDWLSTIDAAPPAERLALIVRGQLAGNLFDMGVEATSGTYADEVSSWRSSLERVPGRPWRIDGLDAAVRSLEDDWPEHAVIFADNAGADVVLGVWPLARALRRRGTRVVIAANERPVLNDVTIAELEDLRSAVAGVDAAFEDPGIELVSSGSITPLIDLTDVSIELAEAARGADLLVLVGMGRGLESNLHVPMTCHTLRIAMVKDPQVARTVRGELFDAVCSFAEPGRPGLGTA